MFILKKNQIIITALAAMVAVAGYLNYIDNSSLEPQELMFNENGELVDVSYDELEASGDIYYDDDVAIESDSDTAVSASADTNAAGNSAETAENSEEAAADAEAGKAVFVNTSSDSSYFIQAKLEREQSRAKQKEILTEMLSDENIDTAKKEECADDMLELQKRIEKETAAESMIEAKGFKEVYVRIDDDTVDVVVSKSELTSAETAQIQDIVKRKTGIDVKNIRITTMKAAE
ncbi:MAG: SpoIIIAH-like family protein [Clostridiales bacterium]|nr:SpoIIIAH-like family protein [Clostridiales bacterium]